MSYSSSPQVKQHDVFISCRADTNNFITHLYTSLVEEKIETFIGNEFTRGDETLPSLSNAIHKLQIHQFSFIYFTSIIQESKISIIFFSKGYDYSRECLVELEKILECKRTYGQIVMPIFYEVNPLDAFLQHEGTPDLRESMVERWTIALTEVVHLCKWVSPAIRSDDSDCLLRKKIVDDVLDKLEGISRDLIGIDKIIKEIESLLCIGSKDGCIVGICGICGIGKSSAVDAMFKRIFRDFEAHHFLKDVGERSEKYGGLIGMRKEILSIFNIDTSNLGVTFRKKKLQCKNALIVLDGVTSSSQIDFLIGDFDWTGSGSQVIIITKDVEAIEDYKVNHRVDKIHEIKGLYHEQSVELFNKYAFKQKHPPVAYAELSKKVLRYAKGIPLVLKFLGSFLLDKEVQVWESYLDKLETACRVGRGKVLLPIGAQDVFERSYHDHLDAEKKNIFLDIACFLKGKDIDLVKSFLDACGYQVESGLDVLEEKSLIMISDNMITMFDFLQHMAREIIQQDSNNNLGKYSRLSHHEDIIHVLTENKGTKEIQGISLDMSKISGHIHLHPNAFSNMEKLRYLSLYSSWYGENKNKVFFYQDLEVVSKELRYFYWLEYPWKTLPSNFHLENLVALYMPYSNLQQLWDDGQRLPMLKYIDLSYSKHLIKCPNFFHATNLERLILKGCVSLLEIHSSIQYLNKLVILDLKNCLGLENIPIGICMLKSLQQLNLSGCSKLDKLHGDFGKLVALKEFKAKGIGKREMSFFDRCKGQKPPGLLLPTFGMRNLTNLDLTDCGIIELPDSLGDLFSIKCLCLGRNNFESIPSIEALLELNHLDLHYCEKLQSLPKLPKNLATIEAQCCKSLQRLPDLSSLFTAQSKLTHAFNFINCFELDRNAVKDIVEKNLQKLQHVTTSWLEEYVKTSPTPSACICFPGSEIPQPFKQGEGAAMTLELPPNWHKDFLVLALCTTVEALKDYASELYVRCECRLGHNDGQQEQVFCGHLWGWHNTINGARKFASDHMFLGFNFIKFPHDFLHSDYSNKVNIQFFLEDRNGETKKCCRVIKCGAHLIQAQDSMAGPSGSSNLVRRHKGEPHSHRD